jgi:large subunit ribosomal protein L17
MRHKVAGYKLGRTTSHRRSLFRNMVTSLIMEERI